MSKLLRWGRLLAHQGLLTAAYQGIVAVAGILVVRALTVSDYAFYVLTLNAVAATSLLAEAGVTSTLMSRGAANLNQGITLRNLVKQATRFRFYAFALASCLVLPVLSLMLARTGATSELCFILGTFAVTSAFFASLSAVSATLLRLNSQFTRANMVLLFSSIMRIALVSTIISTGLGQQLILFLCINLLALILEAFIAGYAARAVLQIGDQESRSYRRALRTNAVRQVPNSAFYVIQGQVLIVILASAGLSKEVAQVAALSRFSVGFVVVGGVVCQIFMTSVARQVEVRGIVRHYAAGIALYACVGTCGLVAIGLLADPLLALLGPAYAGLHIELVLISAGGFISSLIGVLTSLNQARAWVHRAWLFIPATFLWLIALMLALQPESVRSAALFLAAAPLAGVPTMLYCAWLGVRGRDGAAVTR